MLLSVTFLLGNVAIAASYRHLKMTSNVPVSPQVKFDIKKPMLAFFSASAALLLTKQPAFAFNREDANKILSSYDLPPILFIPPGFAPLVSEFGRGNIKKGFEQQNPILVQFCHPSLWVVQKTSVNTNGESGTISANDYIKGDSSFLFVTPATEGESLSPTNKKLIQKVLMQSLSQKGDPLQSFKILAVKEGAKGADGQPYVICDFSYELNTEAGFLIGRRGTVSMTSVGPNIQALVSVTTFQRFKKMGETLSDIANTFRVYKLNSGVFSGAGAGATASN